MYGMIHRAAREMILEQQGAATWTKVLIAARLDDSDFVSAYTYPDEVTLRLLAAAAEALEADLGEMLTGFGRYWVEYADRGPYGSILRMAGDDLPTLLGNLDRMHDAIQGGMPDARLPTFQLLAQANTEIRVAYRSTRTGLEPFVAGLLQGLMARFGVSGRVEAPDFVAGGADFTLSLGEGGRA